MIADIRKTDNIYFGGLSSILHTIFVPLFDFLFVLIYHPFDLQEYLEIGRLPFIANLAIVISIIFGTELVTRILLYFVGSKFTTSNRMYAAWCFAEIVIASLFSALFVTLMMGGEATYFDVARNSVGMIFAISVFPYGFLLFSLDFYARYKAAEADEEAEKSSLVRFYDEYHKLKFIVASTAIVFIRSEDNYVQIYYLDQQKMKKQILRSSMRALEPVLLKHGLVRCHRSYFINPEYIQVLHKDPNGALIAELNREGYEGIPVSRKYQDEITKLL